MARFPDIGDAFGVYEITGTIGRGGMGVVFAADDTRLGRAVALKVLAPQFAEQEDYRERFIREASTLASLDSPHVIHIYDSGERDGCLYIATQYITGGDLGQLVKAYGPVPVGPAARIVSQVAWALQDAHAAHVIHRDVKPNNVLLRDTPDEPYAYLCDFGIAQGAQPGLTQAGSVAGTLAYMSPERCRGEGATPSSDIYALGCLLWTALVGSTPYGGSDVEMGMGHLNGPVPQVVSHSRALHELNQVLQRSMAKNPADRYPTAATMRADLKRLADLVEQMGPAVGPVQPLTAPGGPASQGFTGGSSAGQPAPGSHGSHGSQGSQANRPPAVVPVGSQASQGSQPSQPSQASQGSMGSHAQMPLPGAYGPGPRPGPQPGPASPFTPGRVAMVVALALAGLLAVFGVTFAILSAGGDSSSGAPTPGGTSSTDGGTGGTRGTSDGPPPLPATVGVEPADGPTISGEHYSLKVPADWRETDPLLVDAAASDDRETNGFTDNVNVQVQRTSSSLDDYVSNGKLGVTAIGGQDITNHGTFDIGGEDGVWQSASINSVIDYTTDQFTVVKDGNAVVITVSTSKDATAEHRDSVIGPILATAAFS